MISTTWWPSSWNSRSFRRTTVWPRWMSGVVGSTPSFTLRGRPLASCRSSSPAGRASTALRVRKRAPSPGESVMRPMLDSRPSRTPVTSPCGWASVRRPQIPHGRGIPTPGAPNAMTEPPTPITPDAAARGRRFVRGRRADGNGNGNPAGTLIAPPPPPPPSPPASAPKRKPKLKKLRLALILLGLSVLALVSTLFGMLMAVASDLPSLENTAEFRAAENSTLYSAGPGCKEPKPACRIAQLTGNQNRILVGPGEISPHIKNAVIAVEDSRFYEHEGVDYASIARALSQDILHR